MGTKREGRAVFRAGGNNEHPWEVRGGQLERCVGRDASVLVHHQYSINV